MSMVNLSGDRATTRTNTRWVLGDDRHVFRESGYLSAAVEGKVRGGTILGRVTADSKLRPCGVGVVPTGAASASQTLTDASMFEVGDTIQVYEDDGTTTVGATVTILSKDGNDIVMSASRTSVDGSIIKRTDGSDAPVGILYGDASTFQGSNEHGVGVYGIEPVTLFIKAWIDWDYVLGKSASLKTALLALGFTIKN